MRLLTLISDVQSATSFYRSVGPLQALRASGFDITFNANPEQLDWPTLYDADAVYMERPYKLEHLEAVRLVHDLGVPLWLDYDDDLFSVPPTNPAYSTYNAPSVQSNIKEMLAMASLVTVTTQALRKRLDNFTDNVMIIPNAVNERITSRWGKQAGPRQGKFKILWRGSETHRKDLQTVGDEIVQFSKEHDVEWHFLGDKPWFLTERMSGTIHTPGQFHLMNYFKVMGALSPDVVIVPLEDNAFNRSKSNIAWLEATVAGAMTIAPADTEWQNPGTANYISPGHFKELLIDAVTGRIELDATVAKAAAYIHEHLMLSKVNQLRKQAIERLCKSV